MTSRRLTRSTGSGRRLINVSLQFAGHPKKGKVVARFYFRDDLINEAKVDLAAAPAESDDDDLFVGFTPLKPKTSVSDQYRVEASLDDKTVGVFPTGSNRRRARLQPSRPRGPGQKIAGRLHGARGRRHGLCIR